VDVPQVNQGHCTIERSTNFLASLDGVQYTPLGLAPSPFFAQGAGALQQLVDER
jgi:hypothetical protein